MAFPPWSAEHLPLATERSAANESASDCMIYSMTSSAKVALIA
jgi:hypothetical protein